MILRMCLAFLFTITILSCEAPDANPSPDKLEISIRQMLEMPSCEQIYRDIVYIGEKEKILFFTTTDKEVLFSIDIRIQAGIRNAGLVDIQITENKEGILTAVVSLPKSEILLVDAEENSIEQYFIKERGEQISRLEYYDEINRKKKDLEASAISAGILEKADSNCRDLIRSFLSLSGIDSTEFRELRNEE